MAFTTYQPAQLVLEDFAITLKSALGRNLAGIYLYGSFATGEFDEDLSDLDLLIVLDNEVDDKLLDLLTKVQANFKSKHQIWASRIDVTYLSRRALRTFKSSSSRVIISSENSSLEIVNSQEYYLIDWYKVQEHAIALYGPEATTLIPHITTDEFTKTIYNYMLTYTEVAARSNRRGQQAYIVLTMCRSFYAYTLGEHVSKKQGAEWVTAKYPQWSGLIEKALLWSRDEKNNNINDEQNKQQTQEFVEFVLSKVKN